MTESEWLECKDPRDLLHLGWRNASDRKLRLFAIACCQCSRQLLLNKDHQHALQISSRFADGQATAEELAIAHQRANDFACGLYDRLESQRQIHRWAEATAVANATAVVTPNYEMASYAADAVWMIQRAAHRNPNNRLDGLLRDIFGNPFRPVSTDSAWMLPTVTSLAKAAYGERHLPSGELDTVDFPTKSGHKVKSSPGYSGPWP